MADLLQALQQTYYTPQDTGYGIAADVIGKSTPSFYNPYASTGQNLGVGIGGALVAGLLGGMSRGAAARKNAEMLPQINQIFNAPASERMAIAGDNQRLTPLIAALRANEFNQQQKLQFEPKLEVAKMQATNPIKLQFEGDKGLLNAMQGQGKYLQGGRVVTAKEAGLMDPFQVKAKENLATKQGQFQAEALREQGNIGLESTPTRSQTESNQVVNEAKQLINNSPLKKIDAALKREYEEKARDEVKQLPIYKDLYKMDNSFKQLISLAGQDSKASDIGIIAAMAKIWDPQGVINENEFKVNAEAQAALDSILGNARAFVSGKSRLTNKTKQDMIKAAAAKYNAFGEIYKDNVRGIMGTLKKRGGDPSMVGEPTFQFFKPAERKKVKIEGTQYIVDEATKKLIPVR